MITGLNHINIRAERALLERLCAFYRDVLGLETGFRPPFPGFGYWLYAGSQPLIHLYEALPGRNLPQVQPGAIDHFAFSCANLAAFEARLIRLNIPYETKSIPRTGEAQIFLADPAGNRVELQFAETMTPIKD